jgi:pimeloyl-ACP methyl ester carboxylesterase
MSNEQASAKQELRMSDGAVMKYSDCGSGPSILLVHGVCMSSIFFEHNIASLAEAHRVIAVDLRSHGDSPTAQAGNTVAQYARDLRELLVYLDVDDVTGVGWSMGSFVLWDYLAQFGSDRLSRIAVVSQGPSDLTREGWPFGIATAQELGSYIEAMQADFGAFFEEFVPEMLKDPVSAVQVGRFVHEIAKIGTNAGCVILADQTLRDYRELLTGSTVPHLLVWGADEKVVKRASGEWLQDNLADAQLHVFAESGHCPMWEEPERFNQLLGDWISGAAAAD